MPFLAQPSQFILAWFFQCACCLVIDFKTMSGAGCLGGMLGVGAGAAVEAGI